MPRLLLPLLVLLALALGAPAHAAIVPGQSIDGPSADIQYFGDVDMAPDGTGALTYVKKVGGVDHIFVSRYLNGAWQPPAQVDTLPIGQNINSARPRIAAGNGGRVVVVFLSGNGAQDIVEAEVSPNAASGFTRVQVESLNVATLAEVDMNDAGVAYVAWNYNNNDLKAARLEGTTVSPVAAGGALDADPAKEAAPDSQRGPRIAVDEAGAATLVWSELPDTGIYKVYARSITGTTAGPAAEANLATLPGSDGTADIADMVDVDAAATGTAWVVFRQLFKYGAVQGPRAIARPFSAGAFGPGQVVDGLASPPGQGAEFPRVEVNAAGQGNVTAARQDVNALGENDVLGSGLSGGSWATGFRVDSLDNGTDVPTPVVAMGDNGKGLFAWHEPEGGALGVRVRTRAADGTLGPETVVSQPGFGAADGVELETAADGAGNSAVAFEQGPAATKRIVAAVVDAPADTTTPPGGDTRAPGVTGLALSASVFRGGTQLARLSGRRRRIPTGTTIRWRVDEQSVSTLSFTKLVPGRRVGRRCLANTRTRRNRRRCTRRIAIRTKLSRTTPAGLRRLRFQGRLTRRVRLSPGRYELSLVARDAAGNRSAPKTKRFTLLPRLRRR